MRRILPVVISIIFSLSCSAATLDDVTSIHDAAYRLGISEVPENKYVEAKQESKAEKLAKEYVKTQENKSDISELTYADLSIKQISKEISTDLEIDKETMTGDLSLLWQGAASQSDTINFALYKLANPEEDKPDEKSVKKVLQTIAGMSTLIGAGMGNPILATGSILGGNVLGIMSQDTKALNYKYSKVTDADMIILVRKVEDLQQKTVDLYYEYMTSRKKLSMVNQMVADRKKNFDMSQNSSREIILITDAYYRTALDMQMKARSDFYTKRAALEQFVGNEVFRNFETELAKRDKDK